MKTFYSVVMTGILILFVISLCSPVWAENWQLVKEEYYEAMPDLEMNAETIKVYVDVDTIEKDGSIRGYWVKTVTYDHGLEETFITKVYHVFDCASNRGAIKIHDSGRVVPDHELKWYPVCTGNEQLPETWVEYMVNPPCLHFDGHEFVCGQ